MTTASFTAVLNQPSIKTVSVTNN